MTKILLGLGSNIDRESSITMALDKLQDAFVNIQVSPTFESESVGFEGDNFYNLVVSTNTSLTLDEVISTYRNIEDECGRNREGPKFGPRTLDIDLLTYGDLVCHKPLELPRDEILENAYVLWPLALLVPNERHPVNRKTYQHLWEAYDSEQKLWQVNVPWD